ncbi:MAG TPA: glutamyl-tRNA reductase [Chloroflexota bacterium]
MKHLSLCVTGIRHANIPLDLREACAFSAQQSYDMLAATDVPLDEYVVLSTCNRLEVYGMRESTAPLELVAERILAMFGDAAARLEPYLYIHKEERAVGHLLRVACGLDSAILGEVEILGQVQRAWQMAHQAGVAGPVLSQLFQKGVALGKRVRTETSISRHPASISYAAVVLARQIFGPQLAERKALVIGSGQVGEGVAGCLYEHGVRATIVAHRHVNRTRDVARRYHADIVQWDELPRCLAQSDLVISSTAAPHSILHQRHVVEAMRGREGQPLYLLDLAVPRDVAPDATEVPGVHLHNLDDLHAVVQSSVEERRSSVPEVEAMVDGEVARFGAWLRARNAAPLIGEAQAQAQVIKQQELGWAYAKLSDLDERERRVVETLASRLVGKMLHGPIQWLKAQAESGVASEPDYSSKALADRLNAPATAKLSDRCGVENDSADGALSRSLDQDSLRVIW